MVKNILCDSLFYAVNLLQNMDYCMSLTVGRSCTSAFVPFGELLCLVVYEKDA